MSEQTTTPKKNKLIIVINVIALLIIVGIASYFLYFQDYLREQRRDVNREEKSINMKNIDIENLCSQEFEQSSSSGRGNSGRQELIQQICMDGEVSAEEAEQFQNYSRQ